MAGRKRKAGRRHPNGDLIPETDYGPAYAAMQRLSRTSLTAAGDALVTLGSLAKLETACAAHSRNCRCDDCAELAKHQSTVHRLPRMARDKRLAYPLGILYARGLVLSGEHYAGRRYAALFVAAVRPLGIPSILADLAGRGAIQGYRPDLGGIGRPELQLQYRQARQVLDREGLRVVRVVDEVVIYEEGVPASASPRMRWLECGLHALADHFERADALRRAAE